MRPPCLFPRYSIRRKSDYTRRSFFPTGSREGLRGAGALRTGEGGDGTAFFYSEERFNECSDPPGWVRKAPRRTYSLRLFQTFLPDSAVPYSHTRNHISLAIPLFRKGAERTA